MKTEIIEKAIEARQQEIALYEVNIANFQHMIARIDDGDELVDFREQLKQRLKVEQLELRKANMVMDALQAQSAA